MSEKDFRESPTITPVFAAGATKGEIIDDAPKNGVIERFRSGLHKAYEKFRQAKRDSMLVLSSSWSILSIPIDENNVDLARFSSLDSVQTLRTLYLKSRQRQT